jgi:hypothetical protein
MEKSDIIKYNKLIGIFMGGKYRNNKIYSLIDKGYYFWLDELKYHSNYDWLIPVVKRIIQSIGVKSIDECSDEEWTITTNLTRLYIGTDIEVIYFAVIRYIKWYNKQNKL